MKMSADQQPKEALPNRILRPVCLMVLLLAVCSDPKLSADDTRPNIIMILCDDLGYADVGFNGAGDIRTPQIDRLAAEGTVFSSAYVAHPFCGPSRMGLMTGRYPHEFGAPFNLPNTGVGIEEFNREGVDASETLISTALQRAGYRTGCVGKWHMGTEPQFHPNSRGFDEFFGFLGGGHKYFPSDYFPVLERQRRSGKRFINDYVAPLERNGRETRETEYLTDAFSREACRFVRDASTADQPFFLYLAYNAPHSPLEAKEEDLREFASIRDEKRRTYAAMVYAVDRGIGQLAQTLRETAEYENTLVVFFSDNGGKLGLGADNKPLRQGKGSTYEGGYRVPMFWHWPARVPDGNRYDHPVTALDFYPTLCSLAEIEIPPEKTLSGKNIWAAVQENHSARMGQMIFAMRHRDGFSDVGARRDEWKICRSSRAAWQLFNVVDDIGEHKDLSSEHPDLLQQMVSEVELWSRQHTEPRWFDAAKVADSWKKEQMPRYDETFEIGNTHP